MPNQNKLKNSSLRKLALTVFSVMLVFALLMGTVQDFRAEDETAPPVAANAAETTEQAPPPQETPPPAEQPAAPETPAGEPQTPPEGAGDPQTTNPGTPAETPETTDPAENPETDPDHVLPPTVPEEEGEGEEGEEGEIGFSPFMAFPATERIDHKGVSYQVVYVQNEEDLAIVLEKGENIRLDASKEITKWQANQSLLEKLQYETAVYIKFSQDIPLSKSINITKGSKYDYYYRDYKNIRRVGKYEYAGYTHIVMDGQDKTLAGPNATVGIISKSSCDLTYSEIRNMNITNYTLFSNFNIEKDGVHQVFDDITFTGRILAYNQTGIVTIKDSTINIVPMGHTHGNEVAECHSLYLEGNVTMDASQSTGVDELVWLHPNASLGRNKIVVRAGANVTARTVKANPADKTWANWNFFCYTNDIKEWDFKVEDGAKFFLDTSRGFEDWIWVDGLLTEHRVMLKNFTIGKNATFQMNVDAPFGHRGGHICANKVTIDDGAIFIINSEMDLATALNKRTDNYPVSLPGITVFKDRLSGQSGSITISNPKLMYMRGKGVTAPFNVGESSAHGSSGYYPGLENPGSGTLTIMAQQMNHWAPPVNHGNYFDIKENKPAFGVGQRVASDPTKSALVLAGPLNGISFSPNIDTSNFKWTPGVSFNGNEGTVYSFGRHELTKGDYTFPETTYVGGDTTLSYTPGQPSKVRIQYAYLNDVTKNRDWKSADVSANPYSIPLGSTPEEAIPPGSEYALESMQPYLFWTYPKSIAGEGIVTLEAPAMKYGEHELSALPETYYLGLNETWKAVVRDGVGPNKYKKRDVQVTVTKPLTAELSNKTSHILENAIYFDTQCLDTPGGYTPIVVKNGADHWIYEDEVAWSGKTGVRLEIPTGAAYANKYLGEVEWTLIDSV